MPTPEKETDATWALETERLLIASLLNFDDNPLFGDDVTEESVKQRCIARFGKVDGTLYFQALVRTLPDRRPDLFPELADFQ